jgi:hypothetical protein
VNQNDKPLSIKPNSLLSFDVNDGIGSMQRGSNSIDSFVVNENIPAQFKGLTRSPLPGEPYGVSQVRIITPSGANEYHGSLFFRQQDSSTGVFFQKKINQTNEPPKLFRFTGQDLPRNITLVTGPLITDRIFFFGAFERVSQGNRQIGHLIRGLDNNSFESLGPLITVDNFRNHGNPNATYFKTADATLETRADGRTSRIYLVSDRFNTGKNANEFYGSIYHYVDSMKRVQPLKVLNLPISNNSVANGVDIQIIDSSELTACLQDDNNPANNVAFNTQSGSYEFHCNGNTFSGTATIEKIGNIVMLSQNSGGSILSLTINLATRMGTGSFRSATTTCTINDRSIDNNSCN